MVSAIALATLITLQGKGTPPPTPVSEIFVPHSSPDLISISGGPANSFLEVNEGSEFTHTMTVTDTDTYEKYKLVDSQWVSQGLVTLGTNNSDITATITSGTVVVLAGGSTSSSVTKNFRVTASVGAAYWNQFPNATSKDCVDRFVPSDLTTTADLSDIITPNNKKEILVRVKKQS